ncbi:sensor histidine kinase [Thalassolituus pacificus]|uniref:histidine kinase n=1 Tax=Thalassolituus pacificus TaxID=2975440 RepID=A0A9X2WEZ3_9GAMM|nr:sensor histidine kinase [Thalassolituus pacificus]MCT7359188.1 sensor histidine kinase [Thalassolituus pacificus]
MISLQQQLRRQWLLTLLLLLLPLLWLADYGVRQLTTHTVLSRLQHDADGLIAALTQDAQGHWQVDDSRLGTLYQRVYSGHYFAIRDQQGTDLRSRSLWDKEPPAIQLASGVVRHWQQPGIQGDQLDEQWLSQAQGIRVQNHDFTLWVAEDIAPLHNELSQYRLAALALVICAMLLLMLIQRRQLSRAFTRLEPLQQQLRELRFGERDGLNAAAGHYPQEVQPLTEEIDRLLSLLQQRVSRSRNALGNLAHEMKRPLQQLQLLAEQLDPQHQQQQREALQRLRQLVERELKRARIVGMSSPGRQTKLSEDLPPLLQVLQQLYPQVRLQAHYPQSGVLPQDRDDMLELLGNLLDNACKYASGQIDLHISSHENDWQIMVSDQGPGIDQRERERLLQRGTRLDEDRIQNNAQNNVQGSGLGLAIVSDIVASYSGSLQLRANQPQGLCVIVTLPATAGR